MTSLKNLLAHPAGQGLDLDDPATTAARRRIIREKGFLRRLYAEWYDRLTADLPDGPGRVLEIGAGAGFLADRVEDALTSDILPVPGLDLVADAHRLPVGDQQLRGVVMTNVLHHLQEPIQALNEIARTLRPGGVLTMIEPWSNRWSKAVYRRLHHEPFDPAAGRTLPPGGPLSTANGALPWILFHRDREAVLEALPGLKLRQACPLMPLAYLASGGVSMRSLAPGWVYRLFRIVEWPLEGWGMFAHVTLERVDSSPT